MATDSGVGGSVGDNLTSMAISRRLFMPSAHDFVSQALARFPEYRPSVDDLLHHQFIRQTRKFNATLPQFLHPVVPLTQQTEVGEHTAVLELIYYSHLLDTCSYYLICITRAGSFASFPICKATLCKQKSQQTL